MSARSGWILLSTLWMSAPAGGESAVLDKYGRVTALLYEGQEVGVRTTLAAPAAGWSRIVELSRPQTSWGEQGRVAYTGELSLGPGAAVRIRQVASPQSASFRIAVEAAAEADLDIDGLYYRIDIPRPEFLGGEAVPSGGQAIRLPSVKPPGRHFASAEAAGVEFTSTSRDLRVSASWDKPVRVLFQDSWERQRRFYSAWVELHRGPLAKGASVSMALTLSARGPVDHTPARLRLDPSIERFRFDGFGGNYCWQLESPVTRYTLENLRVAWARTELKLADWEPENDNAMPSEANWDYFASQDKPGSELRKKFLFSKQLQDRGIPQIISIWRLPKWLATDTGLRNPWGRARYRVSPAQWEELLESVGSYLLYARRRYGIEPEIFSFNEPNIGAYVLFTPEEHRDAVKSLGRHFAKLGLKTRQLLAGATGPRGTHEFGLPTANDPEALSYCAAVGFHTWGEGTPEQYAAWGDLAEWTGLPLLVTEMGVDAAAFEGRTFDSYHYAMRELKLYQELLLHARIQGALYWQYTGDYSLARVNSDAVVPTARFWILKQLGDLTPPAAAALKSTSSHPKVLFTAFASTAGGARRYALHVANLGPARRVTITGIPGDAGPLPCIRTSETEQFQELPPVQASRGVLELELPARCLTTLASGPGPR